MKVLKRLVCGLVGGLLVVATVHADDGAGVYNPVTIATISSSLFKQYGATGEYAHIKPDDFKDGHVKDYLDENHVSLTGSNPEPGRPGSRGRVYLTFNGQTKQSCVNNANLALAQHQNHPTMFNIQVNDLPIDAASEVEEACKALPHRLVIILHPPE